MYPVASLDDRRLAAVIDSACLLFAYGGFLALFSSLGGQFTLSKLSAAVYVATFAIVYLQYFALFNVTCFLLGHFFWDFCGPCGMKTS